SGSLCEAWCMTYYLKGRSLWSEEISSDCSWVWKKLMKLRYLAWDHMEHLVGNAEYLVGFKTSSWTF
ncbi:hypothetical protein H0E87_001206, partial [Populus deltoides]